MRTRKKCWLFGVVFGGGKGRRVRSGSPTRRRGRSARMKLFAFERSPVRGGVRAAAARCRSFTCQHLAPCARLALLSLAGSRFPASVPFLTLSSAQHSSGLLSSSCTFAASLCSPVFGVGIQGLTGTFLGHIMHVFEVEQCVCVFVHTAAVTVVLV